MKFLAPVLVDFQPVPRAATDLVKRVSSRAICISTALPCKICLIVDPFGQMRKVRHKLLQSDR